MKKFASCLLIIVLLMACGCGNDEDAMQHGSQNEVAEGDSQAASSEIIVIPTVSEVSDVSEESSIPVSSSIPEESSKVVISRIGEEDAQRFVNEVLGSMSDIFSAHLLLTSDEVKNNGSSLACFAGVKGLLNAAKAMEQKTMYSIGASRMEKSFSSEAQMVTAFREGLLKEEDANWFQMNKQYPYVYYADEDIQQLVDLFYGAGKINVSEWKVDSSSGKAYHANGYLFFAPEEDETDSTFCYHFVGFNQPLDDLHGSFQVQALKHSASPKETVQDAFGKKVLFEAENSSDLPQIDFSSDTEDVFRQLIHKRSISEEEIETIEIAFSKDAHGLHLEGTAKAVSTSGGSSTGGGEGDAYVVWAEELNVRDAASLDGNLIGTLEEGTLVHISEITEDNWGKIDYEGRIGWISIEYTYAAEE